MNAPLHTTSPTLFNFEQHQVRVVTDDTGNPLFVGKDVCTALGYADATTAIRSHCRGVQKLHPIADALGRTQEARVLAEPDVLRLIVNCSLPAAQAFERLVFEDILPSIRKTGSYSSPSAKPARRASPTLLSDARAIDFIGNMIAKVPGARPDVVAAIKLRMIEERTGLPATQFGGALPAELIEDAVKLNPTEIGRRLSPCVKPAEINKILISLGLQRKSESGYVLTEAGVAYGESRPFQAGNKHVGDQINWHEAVVDVVRNSLEPPPQRDLIPQ